ncbi:MAG: N-formylglutamate amidohydrolase [Rhodospirillales bacterium]|nr:MAG: N-formylglutamate amidohydrolase [Rhodospirillales bacterium]
MGAAATRLLGEGDPHPVDLRRLHGSSEIFLTCDHAGRRLPASLGSLGLEAAEMDRHIAWDIGAAGLAERFSERLDAALVMQTYSRLVIDCNRPPTAPTSIATISEATEIAGNRDLSPQQIHARVREVFDPYHDRIDAELELRRRAGRPTVLVSVHSFTPVFHGERRPWDVGLLYNRDPAFAQLLSDALEGSGLVVGHNEPYSVSDVTDYTIPVHGERRGIPHVMIEVRQDLIEKDAGQDAWAERLSDLLRQALGQMNDGGTGGGARRSSRRQGGLARQRNRQ